MAKRKQPEIIVTPSLWAWLKSWFKNSETILLARMQVLTGFLVAAVAAVNWAPLLSLGMDTGFSQKQVLLLGGIVILTGFATEAARRVRAPELN